VGIMAVNWGLLNNGNSGLDALRYFGQGQQDQLANTQMRLQQAQQQQQLAARPEIARQIQSGNYAGARQAAVAAGDTGYAQAIGALADDQRKQLAAQSETIGRLAFSFKSIPQDQRAQTFAALAPRLLQQGFSREELAQVDLSDAGLDQYVALATDLKSAMDRNKPTVVSDGGALVAGDGRVLYENQRDAKWQFDSESGSWLQEPGSGGAGYTGGQPSPQVGNGDTWGRLIRQESGGRQFARDGSPLTSSAGAVGIAQIMPGTAPEAARLAGVAYDEQRYRNDPAYNEMLGQAYFNEQLRQFGNEEQAAAAYNAGPGRVRQAIQRGGENWREYLPRETQQYIARVTPRQQGVGGLITPGNIDINNRQVLRNPDGSISTERSFSIGTDQGEVLIPQVVNGRLLSEDQAITHYERTGQHLGIFRTARDADRYAESLHNRQDRNYSQRQPGVVNVRPPKRKDAPSGYQYDNSGQRLQPIPGGPADPAVSGGRNPSANRKAESEFRKEFNALPDVKAFNDVRSSWKQIGQLAQGEPSAQKDISLIFSFMKMLDPGSVVRESEYAVAAKAAGLSDQIVNIIQKAQTGEQLNARQRAAMVAAARDVYFQRRDTYNRVAGEYRGYAQDNGVNPDRVARRFVPDQPKQNDRMSQFRVIR
jgi:hypothetical protein